MRLDDFIMRRYWVEVLLDDGEEYGCAEDAYTPDQAEEFAIDDCKRAGLNPVSISSTTEEGVFA